MPSLYERLVVPRLIDCACGQREVEAKRAAVVPLAAGEVLEIGIGSGHNLPFYDPAAVTRLTAVEPSAELRRMVAARAVRFPELSLRLLADAAERLPFEAACFDTVVCTFTLCSVQSPVEVLSEIRRVLKPGGRLLYAEHGLSPDDRVADWQRRIEPLWKRLAGGCHLSRAVTAAIEDAGFGIARAERGYLPKAPRVLGWNEWGVATVRSGEHPAVTAPVRTV